MDRGDEEPVHTLPDAATPDKGVLCALCDNLGLFYISYCRKSGAWPGYKVGNNYHIRECFFHWLSDKLHV